MKGKTVLITGATSGIGEGCARKFAAMGSNLILNGRNIEKLNQLKEELHRLGSRSTYSAFRRKRPYCHARSHRLPARPVAAD